MLKSLRSLKVMEKLMSNKNKYYHLRTIRQIQTIRRQNKLRLDSINTISSHRVKISIYNKVSHSIKGEIALRNRLNSFY